MISTVQFQKAVRQWHSRVSSILFVFFFFIALTGLVLGWKDLFVSNIYTAPQKQEIMKPMRDWLPLDSLQTLASHALNQQVKAVSDLKPTSLNALPEKGIVRFNFKNLYTVQVNAGTGAVMHIEKKASDVFIKIHDGALLDDLFSTKGVFKTTYSSLMGLALLFLTFSGFWMRFMPKRSPVKKEMA